MGMYPDLPEPTQPIEKTEPFDRKKARRKLHDLVMPALKTIEDVMAHGDDKEDNLRFKAAASVLDRTGFGTHTSITVEDSRDYTRLSDEELTDKLDKLKQRVSAVSGKKSNLTLVPPSVAPSVH